MCLSRGGTDHKAQAGRVVSCPGNNSSTSVEGEELWYLDAPNTNPPMDTDHEVGDESEEGADGQMSPGDEAETNTHTNQ